jgi:hypothetical protein
MIIAVAEMVTELARGQTAKQREAIWDWFIEDQKRWRALFAPPAKP